MTGDSEYTEEEELIRADREEADQLGRDEQDTWDEDDDL